MNFLRRYYLLALFALLVPVTLNRIEKNLTGVIWGDTEGYYMYLPGAFVIGDFHKIPERSMNARKNAQGEVMMKYTCGVAMFHAPFFFAARTVGAALGKHDPNDYFNKDYCRAIGLSGLCFGFLGLFFLQRTLRKTYAPAAVALAILAVLFGTNLFHYITKESGLSHGYSFCLFAFMAFQTSRFLRAPTWANALLIGGALGWITLIRPTNLMVALLPFLWDVYTWKALRERARWLFGHWPKMLGALAAMFVFFLPQMFYWHEMTGEWVRYSYEGESFVYWDKPKIAEVLFDVQNGLLLYSPIVLFALFGIGMGWREGRHHAPLMTLLFVLATYIFASWWAWWFGGAFGHRCYVEFYALLIFPMAGFFEKTLALKNTFLKWAILALAAFFMYYGTKLSFLYNQLPGPWDGPDWRWNFEKIKWVWAHLF